MPATRDSGLAELLAEVRRIELRNRRLVTDVLAGGYRSAFRGCGIEFDEVREYAEGDDPRTMDWGVSARMGRPYVRKYAEERELSLVILLDLAPSMECGFGAWSQRGAAARIAACLALAAARNSDRVGLLAAAADGPRFLPPRKGARHALAAIRACLELPARRASGGLAALLDLAGRTLRRRAVLFLLSDFLDCGDWRRPLAVSARRHDLVAVRLLGPELAGIPRVLLRALDPEDGRATLVDGGSAAWRSRYARHVAEWSSGVEQELRRARVDRVDVRVPAERDPRALAEPLAAFFRLRERRSARR